MGGDVDGAKSGGDVDGENAGGVVDGENAGGVVDGARMRGSQVGWWVVLRPTHLLGMGRGKGRGGREGVLVPGGMVGGPGINTPTNSGPALFITPAAASHFQIREFFVFGKTA